MINCPICSKKINSLFSMGSQPLANKYPKSAEDFRSEIVLQMIVYYCEDCNYLNIPCDVDRSVFFDDYYYLSSVNKELVRHFENLALYVSERKPRFVIDVGSNDGIFLRPLKLLNINCLGIDPSENVSRIANAAGYKTLVGFFDKNLAELIIREYGKPDIVCASSVFTHLQDPKEFFAVAADLLAENGEILIEVEYLKSIIETLGYERLYFDRPHYYSIKSLNRIADQAGFELVDISLIQAHGGSIRARFRRSQRCAVSDNVRKEILIEDKELNSEIILEKFSVFKSECAILKENLEDFRNRGTRVAAYGCPARFATITNFADFGAEILPYVIDDSPLKTGRFSPGKHIPILPLAQGEDVDAYIVFAYEYINSIKEKISSKNIKFFMPIPFKSI